MAKGEGLKKAFTDLYNEFGRPLVNRIMNELGADATPQQVRRAAKRTAPSLSTKPKKPLAVQKAPKAAPKAQKPLAVQKALPAPPKPLALPAPGPGLPSFAAKPRGGQFYPDAELGPVDAQAAGYKLDNYTDRNGVDRYQVLRPDGTPVSGYAASSPELGWEYANAHFQNDRPFSNFSPENAARMARENYGLIQYNEVGDPEPQAQLGDWLERALAKYYKTEFGSPNDPLRSLAERGLHYDPQMTPELWQREVNDSLMKGPIGYFTVPRHEDEIKSDLLGGFDISNGFALHDPVGQGALMQAAPWLRKQPVTDMLYGIRGALDLGHFTDEMQNALRARETGLPMDLAVRPESLDRMTFAQAVERVGKINQFRAKQQAEAMVSSFDNPAVHTFKEYPDDERGLRWVELKAPSFEGDKLPEGFEVRHLPTSLGDRWAAMDLRMPDAEGRHLEIDVQDTPEGAREAIMDYYGRDPLEQALKYEGDTMGHCVGGYCNDVLSGRARIFSLRDAKGEPHVTIETQRGLSPIQDLPYDQVPEDLQSAYQNYTVSPIRETSHITTGFPGWLRKNDPDLFERYSELLTPSENIIQIKGSGKKQPGQRLRLSSQDFAGEDDYLLPYVQDFVKSQKWGNVRDLENTDLVRLPDGRYITSQQWKEGLGSVVSPWRNPEQYDERYLDNLSKAEWEYMAPYFEGFAIGGRVDADRCFCHNPLSVKKGR